MPHYHWKGLDLQGSTKKGLRYCENPKTLAEELLKDGIALLEYTTKQQSHLFPAIFGTKKSVSQQNLIDFFDYSATLLSSGVPLHKTLILVKSQTTNPHLTLIIESICHKIEKGMSLSRAMKEQGQPFQPFMIQLINTGENTATLTETFLQLALYLKNQAKFDKMIKQAALLPMITLILASVIMFVIFIFVIPQFENFFAAMNKNLPPLTRFILKVSSFLHQYYLYLLGSIILLGLLISRFLHKIKLWRNIQEMILSKVPFVKSITYHINLIRTLQSLFLLLKAGLPIKHCLELIELTTSSIYLKNNLRDAIKKIMLGQKLSSSLLLTPNINHQEIVATFIHLGEQTGSLAEMIAKASIILEEKLQKKLMVFLTFFQPILLIIVGCIIAIIMAAIYLPLFNMSYVMTA